MAFLGYSTNDVEFPNCVLRVNLMTLLRITPHQARVGQGGVNGPGRNVPLSLYVQLVTTQILSILPHKSPCILSSLLHSHCLCLSAGLLTLCWTTAMTSCHHLAHHLLSIAIFHFVAETVFLKQSNYIFIKITCSFLSSTRSNSRLWLYWFVVATVMLYHESAVKPSGLKQRFILTDVWVGCGGPANQSWVDLWIR